MILINMFDLLFSSCYHVCTDMHSGSGIVNSNPGYSYVNYFRNPAQHTKVDKGQIKQIQVTVKLYLNYFIYIHVL